MSEHGKGALQEAGIEEHGVGHGSATGFQLLNAASKRSHFGAERAKVVVRVRPTGKVVVGHEAASGCEGRQK